jgi:molecular chaperone IbpA
MTFIKTHPFEDLINTFNLANGKPTFPHHNIIRTKTGFVLQMALAGFSEEDLDIEISNGVLNIVGKIQERELCDYVHHGIARRSFHKTVQLGSFIEVSGANLQNGILSIELDKIIPEEMKPTKVLIGKVAQRKEFLAE